MLQVDMMVTVPAEQQLQVLSPGTTNKTSQSLAASGILVSPPLIFFVVVSFTFLVLLFLLFLLLSTWLVLLLLLSASATAATVASAMCRGSALLLKLPTQRALVHMWLTWKRSALCSAHATSLLPIWLGSSAVFCCVPHAYPHAAAFQQAPLL